MNTKFVMFCLSMGINLIFIFVGAYWYLKNKELQSKLKSSQYDFLITFHAYLGELSKDQPFTALHPPYTHYIQILPKGGRPAKALAVFELTANGLEMEFFSESFPSFKTMVPFGDGERAGLYVLDRLCYQRPPIMTGVK